MAFAEKISSIRAERKISQAELGRELGVTRFTVMRWEAGAQPDQKLLPVIHQKLGIPPKESRPDLAEQFLGGGAAA